MRTVQVIVPGQAVVDAGEAKGMPPPARNLIVDWVGVDGRLVGPGDVLVGFDPDPVRSQLPDKRQAVTITRLSFERIRQEQDAALAALEGERRRLRAQLAVIRADIVRLATSDPDQLAILEAVRSNAELAAELAVREAERSQRERDAGQVAALESFQSALGAERARLATRVPLLEWQRAKEISEPYELARLRLQERSMVARLGLKADGSDDPEAGMNARVASLRLQNAADLATHRANLERIEAELHECERDSADHTPLAWLRIEPAGGGSALKQIRFLPVGHDPESGWTADHGACYNETLCQGWNRKLEADELLWRDARAAPAVVADDRGKRGNKGGKGGGKGGKGGADAGYAGGLALVSRPAVWSCAVPAGRYQIVVGLGDAVDWDGASLCTEGQAWGLPVRTGPGLAEYRREVEVSDGRLDLALGSVVAKSLRAPSAGVVVHQPSARLAFKTSDMGQPMLHLADIASLFVDGLVLQDLAPILTPGRQASATDPGQERLADRLTLARAILVRRSGERLPADVVRIGAQSVRWSRAPRQWGEDNPQDRIARELRLRPAEGVRDRLRLGETVDIELTVAIPDDLMVLPPHLVRFDDDGAAVQVSGERTERRLVALRVGRQAVVPGAGLDAARLLPPGARVVQSAQQDRTRFRGEAVAGDRTRVSLQWVWGRVKDLVADGSRVEAGQVVMTLYNPQMEADKAKSERDRRAAMQNIMAAAERRRQQTEQAGRDQAERVVAEAESRLWLRGLFMADPLAALRAENSRAYADMDRRAAEDELARLRAVDVAPAGRLPLVQATLRRAALTGESAALTLAETSLARLWTKEIELTAIWQDRAAALGRRELELEEARGQERIDGLADRIAFERAAEGSWWERWFKERSQVKAPVAGRILFLTGWNDQARVLAKVDREFPVWSGMTIAEIVDESRLSFTAEVPDDIYPGLKTGDPCRIEFELFPGRPLPAVLADLGRAFTLPRDRLQGQDARKEVSSRRVFQIMAAFTPPDDLRGRIQTGAKGWLLLP